jgi:carboxyl-terminal processing protease
MKDKNEETVFYDKTDEKRTYPIVVLVNSLTASASEMLAMSLKESYGAILVGTQTYGKRKIQQTSNVGTSSMIKYTTATWYSPNHNCIDGVGIKPSYTAVLTKDYYYNPIDANDSQLTKGLSVLVELLK